MTETPDIEKTEERIILCHTCEKINFVDKNAELSQQKCKRCGSGLFFRKKQSIKKTWVFLITALVVYIPANLEPFMYYTSFGSREGDTIISGVYALIQADLWPLALLVFVASIFVPLAKILGLMFLLLSVRFNWNFNPVERTKIYLLVDIIGRWSMLDVFLVSLMTALVKLGAIADVDPGPGVRYFLAVVILTLFASMSFDSRLIWDNYNPKTGKKYAGKNKPHSPGGN